MQIWFVIGNSKVQCYLSSFYANSDSAALKILRRLLWRRILVVPILSIQSIGRKFYFRFGVPISGRSRRIQRWWRKEMQIFQAQRLVIQEFWIQRENRQINSLYKALYFQYIEIMFACFLLKLIQTAIILTARTNSLFSHWPPSRNPSSEPRHILIPFRLLPPRVLSL